MFVKSDPKRWRCYLLLVVFLFSPALLFSEPGVPNQPSSNPLACNIDRLILSNADLRYNSQTQLANQERCREVVREILLDQATECSRTFTEQDMLCTCLQDVFDDSTEILHIVCGLVSR